MVLVYFTDPTRRNHPAREKKGNLRESGKLATLCVSLKNKRGTQSKENIPQKWDVFLFYFF